MANVAVMITKRQAQVLAYSMIGYTMRQTAAELCIEPDTVKKHLVEIRNRLSAVNTVNAVFIAIKCGMLNPTGKGVIKCRN